MKLSTVLPKGSEDNGLGPILRTLLDDPTADHLVIALVDTSKIAVNVDTGEREPTIRVLRIEAIDDPDEAATVQALMGQLKARRLPPPLPSTPPMFEVAEPLPSGVTAIAAGGTRPAGRRGRPGRG